MSQKKNNSESLDSLVSKIIDEADVAITFANANKYTSVAVKGTGLQLAYMIANQMSGEEAPNRKDVGAIITAAVLIACGQSDEFFTLFDASYEDMLHKRLETQGKRNLNDNGQAAN